MKIGEVAKKTGLTEKAIRLYVEHGLLKPQVEQGLHRNAYEFSEANLRQLEQIAVFRKAGFSIFEISVIQQEPERLPELLESKRRTLEIEVEDREALRSALNRLDAADMADMNRVEQALRPAVEKRKISAEPGSKRLIVFLVTCLVIGAMCVWVALARTSFHQNIYFRKYSPVTIVNALGYYAVFLGISALVMAIRYGTCPSRAAKMPRKGKGKILQVIDEHGFDGRFARAGSGGAGTREPGIGGIWQIVFMIWNELRFDCWFPTIQYTHNGKLYSASYPYGGFRNDFKQGDEVIIAWKDEEPWIVYPLEKKWLTRKAMLYMLLAILMLILGIIMIWLTFPAIFCM